MLEIYIIITSPDRKIIYFMFHILFYFIYYKVHDLLINTQDLICLNATFVKLKSVKKNHLVSVIGGNIIPCQISLQG